MLESGFERASVGSHRGGWEQQPARTADEHPQRWCAHCLERRHPRVHDHTARIQRLPRGPACRRRDLPCPEVGAQGRRSSGWCGSEGGFAPDLPRNEDGLRLVLGAIERAGYTPGEQISIALDCAAQEFCHGDSYHIDGKVLSGSQLGDLYSSWLDNYPITSLEDAFGEDDWSSWSEFTAREGHRVQVVGDDLYVTNPTRLAKGIAEGASNAILIKLNQIGTVSETLRVIEMARTAGFTTVISHRSGETSDDIIADFAVGTDAGQIKTGAPARSDRTSKYNQLLRIAERCDVFTNLF